MTPIPLEEYKDAMRESVCNVCVCFENNKEDPGRCVHETNGKCSLFAHLGEVVNMVSHVNSGSIEDYTVALRQEVCAKCDHQNAEGVCNLRDNKDPVPSWCMLDVYFNLIVGAVEDVQKMHAGEA
jgi:hypothetical protein